MFTDDQSHLLLCLCFSWPWWVRPLTSIPFFFFFFLSISILVYLVNLAATKVAKAGSRSGIAVQRDACCPDEPFALVKSRSETKYFINPETLESVASGWTDAFSL